MYTDCGFRHEPSSATLHSPSHRRARSDGIIHRSRKITREKHTMRFILGIGVLCLWIFPAGAEWSRTKGPEGGNIHALSVSGGSIFAGTAGGVFHSVNNGASWRPVNSGITHQDVQSIAVIGNVILAGTYGGVFLSTNNGTSWKKADSGLTNPGVYSLAVCGSTVYAATNGSGAYMSTDTCASWTRADSGMEHMMIQSFASVGGTVFAGTNRGIFLTNNNGSSWTRVDSGLTSPDIRSLAVSGDTLFAGTMHGGVWRRPLSEMDGTGKIHTRRGITDWKPFSVGALKRAGSSVDVEFTVPRPQRVAVSVFDPAGRAVLTLVDTWLSAGTHRYLWNTQSFPQGCYAIRLKAGENVCMKIVQIVR